MYTPQQWASLTKKQRGPCHLAIGSVAPKGYIRGHLLVTPSGKREQYAHRIAWIKAYGEPTSEKPCVLHHCDNPSCDRISHLWNGTKADNNADMWAKKRGVSASSRPEVRARISATLKGNIPWNKGIVKGVRP